MEARDVNGPQQRGHCRGVGCVAAVRCGTKPQVLLLSLVNMQWREPMLRSALLGVGLAAAAATTAAAQGYYGYPYHPYSYGNPYYSAPYYSGYDAPGYYTGWPSSYSYSYPWGYSGVYGWPYAWAYRPAPAYSDPYVAARPYSGSAGPRASDHVGY